MLDSKLFLYNRAMMTDMMKRDVECVAEDSEDKLNLIVCQKYSMIFTMMFLDDPPLNKDTQI